MKKIIFLYSKVKYIIPLFIIFGYIFWSLFLSLNYKVESGSNKNIKIEIDEGVDIDDIIDILKVNGSFNNVWSFKLISSLKKFDSNINSGAVTLEDSYTNNELINILRLPNRKVLTLEIPENIRLIDDMLTLLEDSLGFSRGDIRSFLDTSIFLKKNNLNFQTLPSFFIPNTYQVYKGLSIESFFVRMLREYERFWTDDRQLKCDSLGLSRIEVSILASIVEEEQDKRIDERPMIAGLYLNRLNNPFEFPYLQADPTVKFANNDFTIKQVLYRHTDINNPYNTYRYKGLPPGPICVPSINAIDAVLNAVQHNYYFMCAGSNGDGYHKFTSTNKEHNQNKNEYKKYQNFK